jgi:hypothetical protein
MNANGSQPKQITHFSNLDVTGIKWMPIRRALVCLASHRQRCGTLIRNFPLVISSTTAAPHGPVDRRPGIGLLQWERPSR